MKISTKGRYALRLLLDIAQNQQDGFVSLKEIAERQEVSKKYLEQIIPASEPGGAAADFARLSGRLPPVPRTGGLYGLRDFVRG